MHIHGQGRIASGRLEQLVLVKAIGTHEVDLGRHHPQILHLPNDGLGPGLDHGPHIDQVGPGGPDLGENRLLVRLLVIDPLVAQDLEADLLGLDLEHVRDALAVELLVVEDENLMVAELFGPLRPHRTLDVIRGRHPEVAYDPERTVDSRLARSGTSRLGEAGIGVGGCHLGHVGALGDGHRDLGSTRVVGADVDHGVGVADGLVRVLRLDRTVPLAGLGRGIIEVDHLEAVTSRHGVGLVHREIYAILHPGPLRNHGALHRPARIDLDFTLGTVGGIGRERDAGERQRCDHNGENVPTFHRILPGFAIWRYWLS